MAGDEYSRADCNFTMCRPWCRFSVLSSVTNSGFLLVVAETKRITAVERRDRPRVVEPISASASFMRR